MPTPKCAFRQRRVEVQRHFERFADAIAVARGADALAAEHLPLHERCV